MIITTTKATAASVGYNNNNNIIRLDAWKGGRAGGQKYDKERT
jgi:hypothetical protein